MNILFIHQNFPAQFKHIARFLENIPGACVKALAINKRQWAGLSDIHLYKIDRGNTPNAHSWTTEIETKLIRGEATYKAAIQLKDNGFFPDIIIAHPGWGETIFIKDVWPLAKLIIYCEFYYTPADIIFDYEYSNPTLADPCRLRVKNIASSLSFDIADAGISPTAWQKSLFPASFQKKISVIHEGIDTNLAKPNKHAFFKSGGKTFNRDDQVITFVNRNLEPYRGYHRLMRSLPKILKENPKAKVLIVGGDGVSYGSPAPNGLTWKSFFLQENIDNIDMSRVFFLGQLPYDQYISLLQVSTIHIYLTYPFVLSWSLLEAMSCGCSIIANQVAPIEEVIQHELNGILVDFFSEKELADAVKYLLQNPSKRILLGDAARDVIVNKYDMKSVCIPQFARLINSLM